MSASRPKPVILAILDGWGHREAYDHNAIASARTPVWDQLLRDYPHGLLNASELHVGLPEGQMGNSEVGHMNIGSGRVLMQELPRIDKAIADGSLAANPALLELIRSVKAGTGVCHLLGLMSPGGVHAHQAQLAALATLLAAAGITVQVHAFLDGRDTPPQSALEYVSEFERAVAGTANIRIATVTGRYYAMDRDKRWDRVQKATDALVSATGIAMPDALSAIRQSYANNVNDEFVLPAIIGGYGGMRDGDGLLMANFRADRAREILTSLLEPDFAEFPRKSIHFSAAVGMSDYSTQLSAWMTTLFPTEKLTRILGEVIADAGLTQLHIAETEKYAHVTFFFNGGREQPFPGEERILIPSPNVPTYDLKPEMSANEITDALADAIASGRFDFIVVNYANTDMVGHTGDIGAAIKAVETVDSCLGRLVAATLAQGGALFVTADHGNAEMMFDNDTEQAHTAHTLNLVPALLIGSAFKGTTQPLPEGKLGDVAPTLLQLLHLPQPVEMTGKSLLRSHDA